MYGGMCKLLAFGTHFLGIFVYGWDGFSSLIKKRLDLC